MKNINSINIKDAPLGMMIKNKKNDKYYIADLDNLNRKYWKLCSCNYCNTNQQGGFMNTNTNLPPNPEEHSWHHHHAPFYQVFNNYVCIKKDTLGEIRNFFLEMFKSS
jgi:hypothetical protein